MLPPPEETLTESPTWLRGRWPVYFADDPVILIMALEAESSTSHPSIIRAKLANDLLEITSLEVSERWEDGF
jgi:hypothetical protein